LLFAQRGATPFSLGAFVGREAHVVGMARLNADINATSDVRRARRGPQPSRALTRCWPQAGDTVLHSMLRRHCGTGPDLLSLVALLVRLGAETWPANAVG
jgi:hypothetical protein